MRTYFLYIGTMQQASRWARNNSIPIRFVLPGSQGKALWRGVNNQPVIVDEGAPMDAAGAQKCGEVLAYLDGYRMMSGKPMRYWHEMSDAERREVIATVKA